LEANGWQNGRERMTEAVIRFTLGGGLSDGGPSLVCQIFNTMSLALADLRTVSSSATTLAVTTTIE